MEILDIDDTAYTMDGGTVKVWFLDSRGQKHELTAVQDMIPVDEPSQERPHWRNGAILLDGMPVADTQQLERLRAGLGSFVDPNHQPTRVPLPKNTAVLGDDLNDFFTMDPESRQQWLLSKAVRRVDRRLEALSD